MQVKSPWGPDADKTSMGLHAWEWMSARQGLSCLADIHSHIHALPTHTKRDSQSEQLLSKSVNACVTNENTLPTEWPRKPIPGCHTHKTVLFSSNPLLVPLKDKSLWSHQVESVTKHLNMSMQYPAVQKHTLLYTGQWNPCVDLSRIHLQASMMESLAGMYDGVTCRHVWWSHLQACMMESAVGMYDCHLQACVMDSLAGKYDGVTCRHVWWSHLQACMMEWLSGMYDGITCRHVWWSHLQASMMESLAGMYDGVTCRHIWRNHLQACMMESLAGIYDSHLQARMMELLLCMYDGVTCKHVWWSHLQACMMESISGMYDGITCRHV